MKKPCFFFIYFQSYSNRLLIANIKKIAHENIKAKTKIIILKNYFKIKGKKKKKQKNKINQK